MAITDVVKKDVAKLYVSAFGRAPDAEGFKFWLDSYEKGVDLYKMAMFHTQSEEYKKAYADVKTNADFVEKVYMNVLNRASDAEGKKFWVNALDKGMTKAAFLVDFIKGAQGDDVAQIANKADFGIYVAENNIPANNEKVQAQFKAITKDAKTLETAKNTVADLAVEVVEGETFTLTNGADKFPATEGANKDADVIGGKVSIDPAKTTLNKDDLIDGGEGKDTLRVKLEGNFKGFSEKGGLKGVEHVVLQADKARDFSAKGVEGVEEYTLKGDANLQDLAAISKINLINRQGEAKIAFNQATAATLKSGSEDAITISVDGVGAAPKKDGDAPKYVKVDVKDVETMTIQAAGKESFVTNGGAQTINVEGDGKLGFKAAGSSALANFDASKAKGALDVNLSNASKIEKIALGAGDDTLTLDINAAGLARYAEIDAGAGEDTLVLEGAGKAYFEKADGVEVLQFGAITGALTAGGEKLNALQKVVVSTDATQDMTIQGMVAENVALQLQGGNASTKTIRLDNAGKTTLVVDTPNPKLKSKEFDTNNIKATLDNSTALDMTVAEKLNYTGTVNAAKAELVNLSIKGKTTAAATLDANKAESIKIDAVNNGSSLTLNASEMTYLEIDAAKSLAITSAPKKLETLKVNTDGYFNFNNSTTLEALTTATFTSENGGAVEVKNIGSATTLVDGTLDITAKGLATKKVGTTVKKALNLGTLTTKGASVSVEAKQDIKGDVTIGAIVAGGTGDVTLDIATASTANDNGAIDLDAVTAGGDLKATLVATGKPEATNTVLADFGAIEAKKALEVTIKALAGKANIDTIKATEKVALDIEASQISLGAISKQGAENLKEVDITLAGRETAGLSTIAADKVALDVSDVRGAVTFGEITAKDSLKLATNKENSTVDIKVSGAEFAADLAGSNAKETLNVTVTDITQLTGNAKRSIKLTGELKAGEDALTINTTADGDNAFAIDLSALKATDGTVTIKTTAAQADAITLGNSKEIVELTGNTAADTITGFKVGAEGDKLNVKDFTGAVTVTQVAGGSPLVKDTVNVFAHDANIKGKDFGGANFAEVFKAEGITTTNSGTAYQAADKAVVLVVGNDQTHVYQWVAGDATIDDAEVTLIGILEGNYKAADFKDANFGVATL